MLSETEYQEIQFQLQQIPTSTTSKSQSNLRKLLSKRVKEHKLAMEFIPFEPLPHIQYFINRTTTERCLRQLLQSVTLSSEFTIDTESINIYKKENKPALMQLQIFLPHNSSFVLLIEVYHLPNENDIRFILIQELFRIIFSSDKQIYIWGLKNELYPFTAFRLFSHTQIDYLNPIDLQSQFKIFWQQQHPHRSSTSISTNTSTTDCTCENCLGIRLSWSLQNAVKFELNEYLSKQFTNEAFHIGNTRILQCIYQITSDIIRHIKRELCFSNCV